MFLKHNGGRFMKNLLIILGSPLWFPLLIAAAAIVFSLYVVLFAVVISIFAIFVSLLASGVCAGIIAGIYFAVTGFLTTGIALIGFGIACIGLSIFAFYASKKMIVIAKNSVSVLVNHLKRG